ncbi:MAG: MGMT family protein [Bryobacterales bacterium]|nr:MGMT family protein [Bryobacterales bacterium]
MSRSPDAAAKEASTVKAPPKQADPSYRRPDPFQRSLRRTRPNAARDEAMRRVIANIPLGFVSSYGKVAAAAGYPGYHRQAAQLLRRDGGELPWQRVVGADGAIKTCFDHGDTQRRLLEAEGVRFVGEKVDMQRFEYDLRPWDWAPSGMDEP